MQISASLFGATALSILQRLGGEDVHHARFIGGCVRDACTNRPISDIDIATCDTPEQVLDRLAPFKDIKTIPTGLSHGTITAIYKKQSFEITTLRRDIETDGRHARVIFTTSWKEDALRRDLTINTLSVDLHGQLYDPLSCGLEDLKQRTIRFVGQADQRIQEDALRILRFFRFYAHFAAPHATPDAQALAACRTNGHLINTLSHERITQELTKLLRSNYAPQTLEIMQQCGLLPELFTKKHNFVDHLTHVIGRQNQHNAPHILTRLFTVCPDIDVLTQFFTLSRAEQKTLRTLKTLEQSPLTTPADLKYTLYHFGHELALQGYFLQATDPIDPAHIDLLKNWTIPTCPINGADLIAEGYMPGPALGAELKRREASWLQKTITEKDN